MADDSINELDVIYVFKPIGWTPFECINELKRQEEYKNKKMTFAGRLDPMACGILPIIITNDGQKRENIKTEYQNGYKTYQFNVIIGVKSDSYDILGIGEHREDYPTNSQIVKKISELSQIKEQEYPPFSSKTVFHADYGENGKNVPLWRLAKDGKLPDSLPTHSVDIQNLTLIDTHVMSTDEVMSIIRSRISTLPPNSDFRQDEILEQWEEILFENEDYTILRCEATVSVGTYIRCLANDLGGICYDIYRTKVKNKEINPNDFDKEVFSIS